MEPVRKLIQNYKNQIDYLMDIDQIVKGSRGSKDIEKITKGLHESQNLIECIMELNVVRESIEAETCCKGKAKNKSKEYSCQENGKKESPGKEKSCS